jgi:hypothetical protein
VLSVMMAEPVPEPPVDSVAEVGHRTSRRGELSEPRVCHWRSTGHGGNKDLRELIGTKGPDCAGANLRFALLEFWSMRTADDQVLKRESYWKDVLLSRQFGHNKI